MDFFWIDKMFYVLILKIAKKNFYISYIQYYTIFAGGKSFPEKKSIVNISASKKKIIITACGLTKQHGIALQQATTTHNERLIRGFWFVIAKKCLSLQKK